MYLPNREAKTTTLRKFTHESIVDPTSYHFLSKKLYIEN